MKQHEAFQTVLLRPYCGTAQDERYRMMWEAGRREGIREGKAEEHKRIEELIEQLKET